MSTNNRNKRKRTPTDYIKLQSTIENFNNQLHNFATEDATQKRKDEAYWPIFRIHHQRSRYIYEMYTKKKEISKECYDYCVKEGYADAALIAKWKKRGYENLCCLRCIQPSNSNFGTTCVCRVPNKDLRVMEEVDVEEEIDNKTQEESVTIEQEDSIAISTENKNDEESTNETKDIQPNSSNDKQSSDFDKKTLSATAKPPTVVRKQKVIVDQKLVECTNCGCHGCASDR
jgi:bud site selection protein 31